MLFATLLSASCMAQPAMEDTLLRTSDTPRYSVDIRMGPYRPRLTSDDARRVYKSTYGRKPLLVKLDTDYFLSALSNKDIYLVGISWGVGFWSVSGKARICSAGDCTSGTVEGSSSGNTDTKLSTVPLTLGVIARLELLRQWGLPLVVHGRVGINYTYYWSSTEGSTARTTPDSDGKTQKFSGGLPGLHGSVGLGLNLDWLDPSTAKGKGYLTGTQLVVEVGGIWANRFGAAKRFDVSNRDLLVQVGLVLDLR